MDHQNHSQFSLLFRNQKCYARELASSYGQIVCQLLKSEAMAHRTAAGSAARVIRGLRSKASDLRTPERAQFWSAAEVGPTCLQHLLPFCILSSAVLPQVQELQKLSRRGSTVCQP